MRWTSSRVRKASKARIRRIQNPSTRRSSIREFLTFLEVPVWTTTALILVSVLGGTVEAGLSALVAQLATTLSKGQSSSDIDLGPVSADHVTVPTLLVIACGLAVLRFSLQLAGDYLPSRLSRDTQSRLRRRLIDAFLGAAWVAQAAEREGEFEQVIGQQAKNTGSAIVNVASAVSAALTFLALIVSAFVISPAAATAAALAASALFALLRPLVTGTRRASLRLTSAYVVFAQDVAESVRLAEEAHVFGAGPAVRERLFAVVKQVDRHFMRVRLLSAAFGPLYQFAILGLVMAGLSVVYFTESGGVASLAAVVLILIRALTYSQIAQSSYQGLTEQMPSISLVRERIERFEAASAPGGAHRISGVSALKLRDVHFAYRPGAPILNGVSLEICRGESVGIVGPSGSGKSTLMQILLRLRDPDEGEYLINGVQAGLWARDDWFQRVAYVPQDSRVMSASVAENIRFMRPWISDSQVEQAAIRANIHGEIMSWPGGYAMHLGQRTDAVSGGQRQRLAMARALAGQPDLLILDEPTSALDLQSERLIQASLAELADNVSVVLVAHRISTLSVCGRVLVMEGGAITADGPLNEIRTSSPFMKRAVQISGSDPI